MRVFLDMLALNAGVAINEFDIWPQAIPIISEHQEHSLKDIRKFLSIGFPKAINIWATRRNKQMVLCLPIDHAWDGPRRCNVNVQKIGELQ